MRMRVQVLSDIHLEFYKHSFPKILPKADYLFLAGDIGQIDRANFNDFFDYVSNYWKQSYYVLGNHEFYHDYKDLNYLTKEYTDFFLKFGNIHLLNRTKLTLEEDGDAVDILGCTLWSNPTGKPPGMLSLSDFLKIKENRSNLSLESYKGLHTKDLEWLFQNYNPDHKSVILTHYPTTPDEKEYPMSHPKYNLPKYGQNEFIKSYFCNNISFKPNASLTCISGHTHYSNDFHKNGIRYISNQLGYVNGHDQPYEETRFEDKTFTID